MRVGGGIQHDPVIHPQRLLDEIHECPLMVGLQNGDLHPERVGMAADLAAKVLIGFRAVLLRLAGAEQIQIRTVQNQQFHSSTSQIVATVSSGVRPTGMISSAMRR